MDEPTTTDTTATADRRSRDSSLCTDMLFSHENALQSRDCFANLKNNITCNIQANMASTSV